MIERADGRGNVQVFDRDGRELSFTLIDHGRDLTVYVDLPRSKPASDEGDWLDGYLGEGQFPRPASDEKGNDEV